MPLFRPDLPPRDCEQDIPAEPDSAEFLRKICLREGRVELRACYPSDICTILQSISRYESRPIQMSKPDMERAAALFLSISPGSCVSLIVA